MPLDRPNRTRAANALAAYLRGEIDNFKLDDETLGLRTDDQTLRHIALWLWHFYDDVNRHTVRATPEGWDALGRCLVFLRTDLAWPARKARTHDWMHAPFESEEQWLAHRHLLTPENIPPYDPARHAKSPWGPVLGFDIPWHWLAFAAVLLVAILYFANPCKCP